MTEPTSQHLYVMQNEFGCIKIGRSVDPWERRHKLRQTEHCRVELIAAFEGGGEDEEAIHGELRDYRLAGEWFNGVDEARAAVHRIFDLDPSEWKFDHNPEGAAKWLDHLRLVRAAKYIDRLLARLIAILLKVSEPSWVHDWAILDCYSLAATGDRAVVRWRARRGKHVLVWQNPELKKWQALPRYTAKVDAALLAWPDDLRPTTWEGSPIECCITALTAIRSRLPKVPRC